MAALAIMLLADGVPHRSPRRACFNPNMGALGTQRCKFIVF